MNMNLRLLLVFLLLSTCLLVTDGRRGGGSSGGSRGRSSSRGSSTRWRPTHRPASRPSPRQPDYKPSPKLTVKDTDRPQPPSDLNDLLLSLRQNMQFLNYQHQIPNLKINAVEGSKNRQPAYNPNYKPESGVPAGPPPLYSSAGHPAPSAPVGPPPPYQPNAPRGQVLPYPQYSGIQPLPYLGLPGRSPAYPGQSAPNPQKSGYPGIYPRQPGFPQRGYPQYPGGSRPYPQQSLGGNIWRPESGMPAPAYMNFGGIPTGTNMYAKPHKQKGFLGSLMSLSSHKKYKPRKHKYNNSYSTSYAVNDDCETEHIRGKFLEKCGKSTAMYTILPYTAYKTTPKLFRHKFMFLKMFLPRPHFHHYRYSYNEHGMHPGYAHYYDIYNNDYVGKCQRPIKKEYTDIRCKATYDDTKCDAKCEDGYEFPNNITLISNRCWHVTGVWRPDKNFPQCTRKASASELANNYMDSLLEEPLQKAIKNMNLDPMPLPDFSIPFNHSLGPLLFSGRFDYFNGIFRGLSKIRRLAECEGPIFSLNETKIECLLNLSEMSVVYDSTPQIEQLFPITFKVTAYVSETQIKNGITGESTNLKGKIQTFEITKFGDINVSLSGGMLPYFFNAVEEKFRNRVREEVTKIIIQQFLTAFQIAMTQVSLPKTG